MVKKNLKIVPSTQIVIKKKKKKLVVKDAPVIKKKKKLVVKDAPVVIKKKKKLKIVPAPKTAEELREIEIEKIKEEIRNQPAMKPTFSIKPKEFMEVGRKQKKVKPFTYNSNFDFEMMLDEAPQIRLTLNNNDLLTVKVLKENNDIVLYTAFGGKVGIVKPGVKIGSRGLKMSDLSQEFITADYHEF